VSQETDTAPSKVTQAVELLSEFVPARLQSVEDLLVDLADASEPPLSEYAKGSITAGGKRLRPLLLLTIAGPNADAKKAVRAATAVELVHNATLIHDDVLDAAAVRRGMPTISAKYGAQAATTTGDLLFATAFNVLVANASSDQIKTLSQASLELGRGELLQRQDAYSTTVTRERYIERCELKTASLFKASCLLGAKIGGYSAQGFSEYGRCLGLAFQMLDDNLDVAGFEDSTGKRIGTDLLDGTVNLPLILARELDPEIQAVHLQNIKTSSEAEALCKKVEATGVLATVREQALALVEQAKTALPTNIAESVHTALRLMADAVVQRDR